MRVNPFRPNDVVSPGMFQGRLDEIETIEKCLVQAKGENPIHFLIEGERGIGKSSLLYLMQKVAEGKIPMLDESSVNFLVVQLDLGHCTSQLDIIQCFGRALKTALSESGELKALAEAVWNWLQQWEVLGVKFNKDKDALDPQEALDELVTNLVTLSKNIENQRDGIVFLIDEADRPGGVGQLGSICKMLAERLTRRGCENILIGLAGLPTLIGQLRSSHESSPRIFQTMKLKTLERDDVRAVIKRGLDLANEQNEQQTKIAKNALELLVSLSEGYPHFIQQFSFRIRCRH